MSVNLGEPLSVVAEQASTEREARSRRLVGRLLVALWVFVIAHGVYAGPWQAPSDRLADAVRTHSIAAWQIVEVRPASPLFGVVGPGAAVAIDRSEPSTIVHWRDDHGRTWWTDAGTDLPLPAGTAADRYNEALGAWLWEAQEPNSPVDRWPVQLPSWVLMIAGLLAIVAGPAPRRGTRWFWFWFSGLPLGLGYLALAVLDLLRGDPQPGRPRRSGWVGIALAIVTGFVLTGILQVCGVV